MSAPAVRPEVVTALAGVDFCACFADEGAAAVAGAEQPAHAVLAAVRRHVGTALQHMSFRPEGGAPRQLAIDGGERWVAAYEARSALAIASGPGRHPGGAVDYALFAALGGGPGAGVGGAGPVDERTAEALLAQLEGPLGAAARPTFEAAIRGLPAPPRALRPAALDYVVAVLAGQLTTPWQRSSFEEFARLLRAVAR